MNAVQYFLIRILLLGQWFCVCWCKPAEEVHSGSSVELQPAEERNSSWWEAEAWRHKSGFNNLVSLDEGSFVTA